MIDALLAPIPGDKPTGQHDEDNPAYQELEQQMSKYGTLHQNSINWERVDQLAQQLLTTQVKHYRVLSHQITYWLIRNGSDGLTNSLQLLDGYLQTYWQNAYPKPGNIGSKHRRRLVDQILYRIDKQAPRILENSPPADPTSLQQARTQLGKALKKRKIADNLAQLDQQLNTLARRVKPATTPTAPPASLTAAPPDAQEARQIKRLLLQQATHINQRQPDDPLGYQLRRYALWADIQSAPPTDQQGHTELSAPPGDRVRDYQDHLARRTVTIEHLQRLEQSIAASPFWLQGSCLAVAMAQQLGLDRVAEAICTSTQAMLQRLPALQNSRFRGGEPFLSETDLAHLTPPAAPTASQPTEAPAAATANLPEWAAQQHSLDQIRQKQGIGDVLAQIEQQQQQHDTPRERSYLQLLASEQLQAADLPNLAHDLLLTTQRRLKNMTVAEWEPGYLQRLQAAITATTPPRQ
ncbi:MAG: type VI secretion system protein TssA [Pseudomonadota bacterium]